MNQKKGVWMEQKTNLFETIRRFFLRRLSAFMKKPKPQESLNLDENEYIKDEFTIWVAKKKQSKEKSGIKIPQAAIKG